MPGLCFRIAEYLHSVSPSSTAIACRSFAMLISLKRVFKCRLALSNQMKIRMKRFYAKSARKPVYPISLRFIFPASGFAVCGISTVMKFIFALSIICNMPAIRQRHGGMRKLPMAQLNPLCLNFSGNFAERSSGVDCRSWQIFRALLKRL